ncbi:uncharacterized protein SCHCODRAFT_02603947 [Schizophyllum commune H4-8]|uniref:uncharacterized protein n=1 Tax=Schizophyllum commune (strain H4-8 / FGSC 9210) TaxID=578458 RepID=UPI00216012B1|nr:uncharacterized protein SCHCODRAFT_02603947 [Schizophyllum commune H4-8]KAI5899015.1 hypothetical protein SCHCODRAFT_02603947 [Schizophyllum commune H4-8]
MTCAATTFGTALSFPFDVDGSSEWCLRVDGSFFSTSRATCLDATRESFAPRTKDDGHPSFAT